MNNYNLEYLNDLIKCLKNPNILKPEEKSYANGIYTFGVNFLIDVERFARYTEGHSYHDETQARQLVIDYINNPECTKALQPHHKKIVEIYNRLAHLSKGKGTWADEIDRELLLGLEQQEQQAEKEEDVIEDLDQMIARQVLLPIPPQENLSEDDVLPLTSTPDPLQESYSFSHVTQMETPTASMLFHIHADEFGNSSEYEGGSSKNAVNYLLSYLQKGKGAYSQDLIEELNNVVSIQNDRYIIASNIVELTQNYVHNARGKISESFKSNKPLLIMGGWKGRPFGHAIYYEIIPTSDNIANFRLYNSGAGSEYHPHHNDAHKTKYQAYTEWQEIDRSRLESDAFLEAVFELNSYDSHPINNRGTEYDKKDIYEGLKGLLKPKKERPLIEFKMKSPQRSGVCSWKSLMAFAYTRMQLNEYKRFKCDIKLQSLKDFVDADKDEVTPKEWLLVKKSRQNLCQSILRIYRQKLIGMLISNQLKKY